MELAPYLKVLERASESDLVCRCCGKNPYVLTNESETICTFCEAYINEECREIVSADSVIEAAMQDMHSSILDMDWEGAVIHAEALAATDIPYLLFGAAAFYKAFSDRVYSNVNYEMDGFMYPNAAKRSDEPDKNKYNAMALISRSKGLLFRIIHIEGTIPEPDPQLLFTTFMANMKLGRTAQAARQMTALSGRPSSNIMRDYASMVYSVRLSQKDAQKHIDECIQDGTTNALYYMSRHLAATGHIDDAIRIAQSFTGAVGLPDALHFSAWLSDVKSSSGI